MEQKTMESLNRLYRKHGIYFNMALTHLFDVGMDNILEVDLEKVRSEAEAREKEILDKGNFPIMLVDFQVEIVRLAQEIRKITKLPSDLMVFVIEKEMYQTPSPSRTEIRKFAENMFWLAKEENLTDYDEEEDWMQHVADYVSMEPEDIEEILDWR